MTTRPQEDHVIELAKAYVAAVDARRYSHAQNALSRLAEAVRQLEAGRQ